MIVILIEKFDLLKTSEIDLRASYERQIKSSEIQTGNRRQWNFFNRFKEKCLVWHHRYLEPNLVKQKIKEYNSDDDEKDGSTSESYLDQLDQENTEIEMPFIDV